jgi:hypothetical protein
MKLWKERRGVPFNKSFLLEVMTIEGCKGSSATDYSAQLSAALQHIRDTIESCNVKDPANGPNSLSDDLVINARAHIKAAAEAALRAQYWSEGLG